VKRSPRQQLVGLLAASLLSSALIAAAPAAAHTRSHSRHPAGAPRQAEKKASGHAQSGGRPEKTCRRRGQCETDTGGTAAAPAKLPRVVKRERAVPKTTVKAAPLPTPAPAARRSPSQLTAAVIAGVLATPCADTELIPTADNVPLLRASVLCLINRIRAEHGLDPLAVNQQLESAAEGHCAELISADYFAHVAPDGETPVDRIRRTGYIPGPSVGYVIGENLAWGTYSLSTPQSIVAAWVASPGHLANILESQYKETGIGIVPSVPVSLGGGSPGASYAQEFGVIIR
jgi:uncharacterized protein YkwD